jgi:hypothetical protein
MSGIGGAWRVVLVACLAVAWAVASAAAPAADAPRAKRVEEAKAAFDTLFAESIRKVKATASVKDDIELAKTFLAAAETSKGQPELTVLAAAAAVEYGSKGPDGLATALEGVGLILSQPPEIRAGVLDTVATQCQGIVSRSSGADREKAGEQLVAVLKTAGDDHAAAGDYAKAAIYYRKALDAATAIKSYAVPEIQPKLQTAMLRQAAAVRIEALAKQLETSAADTAARDELIRLHLVDMDDPARAATYVDPKSEDVRSKTIRVAGMSVGALPEAACRQLAELYVTLGDQAVPACKTVMYGRAKAWYGAFLEKHTTADVQRMGAELALKGLDEKIAKLAPKPTMPPGAVCTFTFDRPTLFARFSETFVRDLSGQNNNGLMVNGGTVDKGRVGEALVLDGTVYVQVANSASLRMAGDQTIAMWVCPSGPGSGSLFDKRYFAEGNVTYGFQSAHSLAYVFGDTSTAAVSSGGSSSHAVVAMPDLPEANAWTHIAVVRDLAGGKITWYKNGKKVAEEKTTAAACRTGTWPVWIGNGYVGRFVGKIDEFVLYARALSAAEVQSLYGLGTSGTPLSGTGR